jgi:hypothetical protein
MQSKNNRPSTRYNKANTIETSGKSNSGNKDMLKSRHHVSIPEASLQMLCHVGAVQLVHASQGDQWWSAPPQRTPAMHAM